MSGVTVFTLCLCTAFVSITISGHAFAPDKFPEIQWKQIAGWSLFGLAMIFLD